MIGSEIIVIKSLMANFERDWAICGGWSIDLFLGRKTRQHKDIDLLIWRKDQLYAQKYFVNRGWHLQVAANGQLSDWERGEFLELPKHGIWCKHKDYQPDFIELLLNETESSKFLFRRNTSIQLPLNSVIQHSHDGLPFLTPEIALLYKAHNPSHEGNRHDFEVCFQKLTKAQQNWLRESIRKLYSESHRWLV